MKKEFQKFWLSQPAVWIKGGKCLLVESAQNPGFFGLPGGRIDEGEPADVGFARELKEETGIYKFERLAVVDYLVFYDVPSGRTLGNPVCAVVNLIRSDQKESNQDPAEHLSFTWISEDEIDNYKYCWYGLNKSIKKAFAIYKNLNK